MPRVLAVERALDILEPPIPPPPVVSPWSA
jgi:hypothetical protein